MDCHWSRLNCGESQVPKKQWLVCKILYRDLTITFDTSNDAFYFSWKIDDVLADCWSAIVWEIHLCRLLKERQVEDHLFGDKESFVTTAYKKKLEEDKKWQEEEKMRDKVEAEQDVRKRGHMGDFYRWDNARTEILTCKIYNWIYYWYWGVICDTKNTDVVVSDAEMDFKCCIAQAKLSVQVFWFLEISVYWYIDELDPSFDLQDKSCSICLITYR